MTDVRKTRYNVDWHVNDDKVVFFDEDYLHSGEPLKVSKPKVTPNPAKMIDISSEDDNLTEEELEAISDKLQELWTTLFEHDFFTANSVLNLNRVEGPYLKLEVQL